jgi:hypothetical protein
MSPEDEALGTSEVAKSQEVIKTVHLERTHGSDRDLQEKVLIGEPHREIAHRDIENPVDKRVMHFSVAMSKTLKGIGLWSHKGRSCGKKV